MNPVKQKGRSRRKGQRLIRALGGPEWCRAGAGEVQAIEAGEASADLAALDASDAQAWALVTRPLAAQLPGSSNWEISGWVDPAQDSMARACRECESRFATLHLQHRVGAGFQTHQTMSHAGWQGCIQQLRNPIR